MNDLVGKVQKTAKKPWITQEIIIKMHEQRKWKNTNNKEGRMNYRKLRNKLKKATQKAKKKNREHI
jgi:hypothetical protein